MPALLTVDDALAADSRFEQGPVIWAEGRCHAAQSPGAPQVVEGSFEVGGQEHFYLEGQVAAAIPQEGGDMVVHSSTQHPTEVQHKVAHALAPADERGAGRGPPDGRRLRRQGITGQRAGDCLCGGGAGDWGGLPGCAMTATTTWSSPASGMTCGSTTAPGWMTSGRILGLEFTHLFRCGWSQDLSPAGRRPGDAACRQLLSPAAHVRIESHRLKTNTQSATAYRGFGGPQGMVGIERVMDHVAFAMGREPLEVRKLNFYAPARVSEATCADHALSHAGGGFHRAGPGGGTGADAATIAARKAAIAALECGLADPEARDRADAGEVRDFASR